MKAPLAPLPLVAVSVLLSVGVTSLWFLGLSSRVARQLTVHQAEELEAARPEKPWDFWTPEMENVARELSDRRAELAKREADLATSAKLLATERQELDAVRAQLEALRTEIEQRLLTIQAQELQNLTTLAGTYDKISPAAAVAIFSELDDALVAKLLSLMKPDVTSAVLQQLGATPAPDNANSKRAAELTRRLRLLMPAPAAAG